MTGRTWATVAIATRQTPADGWGAALGSDYLAVQQGAVVDSLLGTGVMAGLAWRAPHSMRRAILEAPLGAAALLRLGVADAILEAGEEPLEWARAWVAKRSVRAMASAALLLRNRHGGIAMERYEFARLFSTGEPQTGLARFLSKQPLDFSETTEWEIR